MKPKQSEVDAQADAVAAEAGRQIEANRRRVRDAAESERLTRQNVARRKEAKRHRGK